MDSSDYYQRNNQLYNSINALIRFIGREELNINLLTNDFLEIFNFSLNKEKDARTYSLQEQGNSRYEL